MGRKKKNYYCVANGRQSGIYKTWSDCKRQVNGFSRAKYKGFETKREADDYMRRNGSSSYDSNQTYSTPASNYSSLYQRGSYTPSYYGNSGSSYSSSSTYGGGSNYEYTQSSPYDYSRSSSYRSSNLSSFLTSLPTDVENTTTRGSTNNYISSHQSSIVTPQQQQRDYNHSYRPKKYYAVAYGRNNGIYRSWPECRKQTENVFGAKYKSFYSEAEAKEYINTCRNNYQNTSSTTSTGKKRKRDLRSYNYDDDEEVRILKKRKVDHDVVCFTDGACNNNGKRYAKAGVGVYFGENDPRNVSRRLSGKQTNNRAELTAILDAMKAVDESVNLEIRSDSHYSMNVVRGIWKANKNPEIVEEIQKMMRERSGVVKFKKVKAHTRKKDGNYYADKLAVEGSNMPRVK